MRTLFPNNAQSYYLKTQPANIRSSPPEVFLGRGVVKIQWNLLIADILFSGHVSTTDTFLRNWRNDDQILIIKLLCSGHSIADTSVEWASFLGPNSHYLSIVDTSNMRHFLQEICIHFTLDNVLQFRFSFL